MDKKKNRKNNMEILELIKLVEPSKNCFQTHEKVKRL